jgi:hypothetical protein
VRLFSFRPEDHAARYREQGWVHIPSGASRELCALVHEQLARHAGRSAVDRPALSVAKDQYVLELPDERAVLCELFQTVGELCGLDASRLTLSERHVNRYAADASPFPRPHKDRLASQVSLGISIVVPPGSHLVLWPDDDRSPNPLQRPGLTESLPPAEAPEVRLSGCREVVIHDQPGDVMVFPGSTTWHTRRRPAGAVVVYFKCNDFASDPLGEDPRTAAVAARSRRLARRAELRRSRVRLGRRFEAISRERPLRIDDEWVNVHVAGQSARRVTERECALLLEVGDGTTVAELCAGSDADVVSVARLVSLGALDVCLADPLDA